MSLSIYKKLMLFTVFFSLGSTIMPRLLGLNNLLERNIKESATFEDNPELELKQEPIVVPAELSKKRFDSISTELNRKPASLDEYSAPFGKHSLDPFLHAIKQIESSGGTNTKHERMDSGMHANQRAMGKYGLMPKTVKDIVHQYGNKQSALRYRLGNEYTDPEMEKLASLPENQLESFISKNPEVEHRLARYLATAIAQRMKDDPKRMAYAWNNGSSLRHSDVNDKSLKKHKYVNKFRKYRKLYESDPRFSSDESGD